MLPEESEFLNIAPGQPVYTILRTTFDATERPVEACMNILSALRWRLTYAWGKET